ncbi:MAG: PPC domain-containing protein, partial [Phycisphaerae bacterium]
MRNSRALLATGMMLAAVAVHVTADGANAIDILDILFGSGRQNRPSPQRVLQNGHTVTALAGSPGMRQYFQIDIRPGTRRLTVGTTGSAGDCDLYLSRGVLPEPKSYQYVSNGNGADEAITISGPAPGTWYALVYGYGRFGGVSLTASWSIGQPDRPRPIPLPHRWIRITSPAAGGVLTAGESYWVHWTTSGHSRRIRVLQSFDDGRTWTDIAPRSAAL